MTECTHSALAGLCPDPLLKYPTCVLLRLCVNDLLLIVYRWYCARLHSSERIKRLRLFCGCAAVPKRRGMQHF